MLEHYFPFGIERYAIGGILIGLAVALLFISTGRLGGASSVFSSSWTWLSHLPYFQDAGLRTSRSWRIVYAIGMLLGGVLFAVFFNHSPAGELSLWRLILGGLLIGFGARLGGGCTSGHGICGIASLSKESLVIVVVFLSVAIITASTLHYLGVAL